MLGTSDLHFILELWVEDWRDFVVGLLVVADDFAEEFPLIVMSDQTSSFDSKDTILSCNSRAVKTSVSTVSTVIGCKRGPASTREPT